MDTELRAVVERCMLGYQDYATNRRALSQEDGAAFIAPTWCAFENSVLWFGGCRPSLTIHLLYNLSGEGLKAQVEEMLSGLNPGVIPTGALGITSEQLVLINDLHGKTVHQENDLLDRLATLQEDIADHPLLPIVRQHGATGPGGAADAEVDTALDSYKAKLALVVVEADELRMATMRALVTEILMPRQALQALEMLAIGKHLQLSVREWSRRSKGAAGTQQEPNRSSAARTPDASST